MEPKHAHQWPKKLNKKKTQNWVIDKRKKEKQTKVCRP